MAPLPDRRLEKGGNRWETRSRIGYRAPCIVNLHAHTDPRTPTPSRPVRVSEPSLPGRCPGGSSRAAGVRADAGTPQRVGRPGGASLTPSESRPAASNRGGFDSAGRPVGSLLPLISVLICVRKGTARPRVPRPGRSRTPRVRPVTAAPPEGDVGGSCTWPWGLQVPGCAQGLTLEAARWSTWPPPPLSQRRHCPECSRSVVSVPP